MARRSLGQGIYQDAHGITVIARLGSGKMLQSSKPVRFPLFDADGVAYSRRNNRELVECYLRLRAALIDARALSGGAGSIGVAVDAFLDAHPVVKGAADETRCRDWKTLLAHWRTSTIAALPVTTPTATLRPKIAAVLESWTQAGAAASSVNRRKYALAAVFRATLKPDADGVVALPTENIPDVPAPNYEPRGVDLAIIARILSNIPDLGRAPAGEKRPLMSTTKVRLTIMAWTGLTNIALVRLARNRVRFHTGELFLPPRKKGKRGRGAHGIWIQLLPPALDALRAYDDLGLWGSSFSNSSMHKSWRKAVKKTRAELVKAIETAETDQAGTIARRMLEQFDVSVPGNCHPYDLRHSYATEVYRRSGDVKAAQEALQHGHQSTTDRYLRAAVPERVANAIDKMRAHWFPDAPKPSAVVRDFQVVSKANG